MADWLNTFFAGFDTALLTAAHRFAVATSGFFGPFFHLLCQFTAHGLCYFALGLILCLFKRTRPLGAVLFGSVSFGAFFSNILLRDIVARVRPFLASELFRSFWEYAGAIVEEDFSFPSGHATAVTAAAMGCFFMVKAKKRWWPIFFAIPVIQFARIYFAVHYPSDVLAGFFFGTLGAIIAYTIVKVFYAIIEKYPENGFCRFALDFDLPTLLKKKDAGKDSL